MSETNIPLQVFTALSTQAAPRIHWKTWGLGFTFYQEKEGRVSAVVTDYAGLLDTDRPPVMDLRVPLQTLINTAKDLEILWSCYSNRSQAPEHNVRALAAVGRDLFDLLFPVDKADPGAVSNVVRAAIRESAASWIDGWRKDESQSPPSATRKGRPPAMSISFYSNCLHLPWNLLYLFDRFDDYQEFGFFGIAYSTEECSTFDSIVRNPKKEWGVCRPVEVSLQLDMKINKAVHGPVLKRLTSFPHTQIKVCERPDSKTLRDAFELRKVTEELLYFCCHTHERPPQLRLTDVEPLSAVLIEKWASAAELSQWPVVFLNTCRGGFTSERYRTDFVSAFMRGGSVAVIGAEAEIDETYAAWFGSEFLRALFEGNTSPESLGDLVYRVRQAGLSEPVGLSGLLYSVYSRIPVRFRGHVSMKKSTTLDSVENQSAENKERGSDAH
jgi:hypothetical protein